MNNESANLSYSYMKQSKVSLNSNSLLGYNEIQLFKSQLPKIVNINIGESVAKVNDKEDNSVLYKRSLNG